MASLSGEMLPGLQLPVGRTSCALCTRQCIRGWQVRCHLMLTSCSISTTPLHLLPQWHVLNLHRAAAAATVAIGSKAAMMAKSAGGASGIVKGVGLLAAGGTAAAAATAVPRKDATSQPPLKR